MKTQRDNHPNKHSIYHPGSQIGFTSVLLADTEDLPLAGRLLEDDKDVLELCKLSRSRKSFQLADLRLFKLALEGRDFVFELF